MLRDRPTKPELKLLEDLREFIASHDLPPNEVPTTAELARHGRWAPLGLSHYSVSFRY